MKVKDYPGIELSGAVAEIMGISASYREQGNRLKDELYKAITIHGAALSSDEVVKLSVEMTARYMKSDSFLAVADIIIHNAD